MKLIQTMSIDSKTHSSLVEDFESLESTTEDKRGLGAMNSV
jgi:hypothetical protein